MDDDQAPGTGRCQAGRSAGPTGPQEPRLGGRWRRWGLLAAAGSTVVLGLGSVLASASPASPASPAPVVTSDDAVATVTAPVAVPEQVAARLPQATTDGTVPGAPHDSAPEAQTSGRILHPTEPVPVYTAPRGPAIAMLPPTQRFGDAVTDTAVPVVEDAPGWARVLLPVRPNGSTGWIWLDDAAVTTAHSPWRIDVDRAAFTVALWHNGSEVGHWRAGVGKAGSPTPSGRTFLLSAFAETHPTYSPVILPLGAHSDTYTTYGGGPGTVGLHTWPNPSVFGRAASDGCVRIPADALGLISAQVPIGTLVRIS